MEQNEALGRSLHMQSLDAIQTIKAEQMSGTRHVQLYENGIAVIDMIGPIFPRSNLMTMSSGMSISQFTQDFVKAEAHPNVTGIVINIDSPGGDVRGIGDAAKIISAVTKQSKKPIRAFVSGIMASAAYYVGSAVGPENIISTETGIIGSIGVVMQAMAKGKDQIEIVSSQSPYKRADPTTDDGKALMQQQVDDIAEIMVRDIAKYRKVSQAKVLADYGQGATHVAPRALKQGLVDSISTLSDVVEQMASGSMGHGRSRTKASEETHVESLLQFTEEENDMGLKDIYNRFKASGETLLTGDEQELAPDDATPGAESEDTPAVAVVEGQEEAPEVSAEVVADPVAQAPVVLTREALEEKFSDAAELFATQMTVGSKIFPAQSAYAASDLLTAKIDDALYGGSVKFVDGQGQLTEGTREEAVRARYHALPKHSMTEKSIEGIKNGSIAAHVLASTDKAPDRENDPVSEDRRKELLAASSLGQAVLSNAHNQ